jgi:metallophosphoesterase superfamily enzyme
MFNKLKTPKEKKSRVLVIADLHCPWDHPDYLQFCKDEYRKWKCDTVLFIGDILDSAAWNFHETNPDMPGAADELELAKSRIAKWYKAFPKAAVTWGNHDKNYERRLHAAGIPFQFRKELAEVLGVPGWNFVESIEIDGVFYCHGLQQNAESRVKSEFRSCVSGHYHSLAYIKFFAGSDKTIFAAQVGVGVDDTQIAFAYGKWGKKSVLSCLVVIDGTQPILIPMYES